ncbi:hypothetical protein CBS101457_000384 [Exobasidium rhododendri]|nr:hypothetical protein CBS101457_000384 [Exobasidium rhododendri]
MNSVLLVRKPPKSLAEGIVSHIEDNRDSIDYEKALAQWQAYTEIFKERGWKVEEVTLDDDLPDSVFVEDGVIFVNGIHDKTTDGLFILASPGNVAREGEIRGIEDMLKGNIHSSHSIAKIVKPGTLDGGDVLKIPSRKTIYVGKSQRTNDAGIQQFTDHVTRLGWQVKTVPVIKALHLKSMITALPDGTIIGYESLLENSSIFPSFLAMPEAEGAAVVFLDSDVISTKTLLISSSAPESAKLLQSRGYEVIKVEVSEFEL